MLTFRCFVLEAIALLSAILLVNTTAFDLTNLPSKDFLTQNMKERLFSEFCSLYEKQYSSPQETNRRFELFSDNLAWMIDWNADPDNTHTVGVNQWADLDEKERRSLPGFLSNPLSPDDDLLDYYDSLPDEENSEFQMIANHPSVLRSPKEIDWNEEERERGRIIRPKALLPVRDTGKCGASYSFAAMTTLEALHRIDTYETSRRWEYFSVQQGLDCTGRSYDCHGCEGGSAPGVFQYVIDNNGICTERDYPYEGRAGRNCQARRCRSSFKINGFHQLNAQSESKLLQHLAVNPLAVMVTGSTREFLYYTRGIISDCGRARDVDLYVVATGYDIRGRNDFVTVRPSWGRSWGQGGSAKLAVGNNVCKWRTQVSYPYLRNRSISSVETDGTSDEVKFGRGNGEGEGIYEEILRARQGEVGSEEFSQGESEEEQLFTIQII